MCQCGQNYIPNPLYAFSIKAKDWNQHIANEQYRVYKDRESVLKAASELFSQSNLFIKEIDDAYYEKLIPQGYKDWYALFYREPV